MHISGGYDDEADRHPGNFAAMVARAGAGQGAIAMGPCGHRVKLGAQLGEGTSARMR